MGKVEFVIATDLGSKLIFTLPVPPLQADMMEILYRAAKQDCLKDVNIAFQALPKVKGVFEYLVAKPLQVLITLCINAGVHNPVSLHLRTALQPGCKLD